MIGDDLARAARPADDLEAEVGQALGEQALRRADEEDRLLEAPRRRTSPASLRVCSVW